MTQQPAYQPQTQPQTQTGGKLPAVLAHLSAPIAALLSAGLLSIVGPLLVWLIYRDSSPLARKAAAGAFNFNLSFWVLYLIAWVLNATVIGLVIGIPLIIVIFVVSGVLHLLGALAASGGRTFEYPFQIRVLS